MKMSDFPTLWLQILGVGLFMTSSRPSQGEAPKQSVFVNISVDEPRALEDLNQLKSYDLAGVRWDQHQVELIVDGQELEEIQSLGFQVSFAPEGGISQQSVEGYQTPDEVVQGLEKLATSYPETVRLFELGKTTRQRPIMGIEISNHLEDPTKPVVLFNAMHHAREVMTTEVLLHMAETLAMDQGQDPQIKTWLDQLRVVIVPQVNPDGNALVHEGRNMWRKNAWSNQDKLAGVDLNRNYPAYWNHCNGSSGSSSSDTFRGPTAGSEPETKALMNLISQLKPIADISYHSYGEMIIYPFGCSSVNNIARELFQSVGQEIKQGIVDDGGRKNTYRLGTAPQILYEADGTDLDWQWNQHGVLAYTIEMNTQGFQPDYKSWRSLTVTRQEGGWRALLDRMVKSGVQVLVKGNRLDEVTVVVNKKSQPADHNEASFLGVRWSLRSSAGLVYNLLTPGRYELMLYRGDQVIKSLDVDVQDKLVDL